MRQDNIFESLLSAAVVAVALGFVFYMYHVTGGVLLADYELKADMAHVDGLASGASDVVVAGTKVGTVTALNLDPRTYRVKVSMRIRDDVKIPADSKLGTTSGVMSSQAALAIIPGRSSTMLEPGATLVAK